MNFTAAALTSVHVPASCPLPRTALHGQVCAIGPKWVPGFVNKDRVLINIRGRIYETYQSTLDRYPDTLLGSKVGRASLYDCGKNALVLDRNPVVFDSILFFYQSRGILARPEDIPERIFKDEVQFYGIESARTETEEIGATGGEPCAEKYIRSTRCPCEKKLRERAWEALEDPTTSRVATAWASLSVAAIVFSVIVFCLETALNCSQHDSNFCLPVSTWQSMEQAVVIFFTFDYLLRLYSAPQKLKFIKSIMAVVDLASFAPYYITLITPIPSIYVALRLWRVVRLLKLSRYSTGLKLIASTLLDSLHVMGSLMVSILMTVILFSTIQFHVEDYPGTEFTSIPAAFWWAIVTMTTVGYGDMVPLTLLGKIATSFCAIGGVIFLYILPLPAFVMNFSKRYEETITNKKANWPRHRQEAAGRRSRPWPAAP